MGLSGGRRGWERVGCGEEKRERIFTCSPLCHRRAVCSEPVALLGGRCFSVPCPGNRIRGPQCLSAPVQRLKALASRLRMAGALSP